MKAYCMLTSVEFDTKDPKREQVCPAVADAIMNVITRDESLRRRVSADILGDAEIMQEIAKTLLSVAATAVGLGHPGTVGEFFLNIRDDLANT